LPSAKLLDGYCADEMASAGRGQVLMPFSEPRLVYLGGGRVVPDVRETCRVTDTGDFADAGERGIDLTIRDGKIARYERRVVG
jgi:hypothetical protein